MYGSNFPGSRSKEVVAIFIEGSFCPVSDGYSFFMLNLVKALEKRCSVIIVHNYRGWSDWRSIRREVRSSVYLLKPSDFYNNTQLIKKILRENKITSVIMTDQFMILKHGYELKKDGNIKLIYNVHSVSSNVLKNLSKSKKTVTETARRERFACAISDGILCFTREDKKRLQRTGNMRNKIHIIRPVVPQNSKLSINKGSDLIFLGNMFYEPNERAVRFLINTVAPYLHTDVKIHLVGSMPKNLQKICSKKKNIVYHGYVKKIRPVLKQCRLAVVPVKEGSGIRMKILEFFSHGMPVLGFHKAFEGIPNAHRLGIVVEERQDIVKKINKASLDVEKLNRLSHGAYDFIRNECNGEEIASIIHKIKNHQMPPHYMHNGVNLPDHPIWVDELIKKGKYAFTKLNVQLPQVILNGKIQTYKPTYTIVLEGIPGTGKTTLLSSLGKYYKIIPVPQIIDIPKPRLFGNKYYLESEYLKHLYAFDNNRMNFFDRNFVSLFAYSYALDRLHGTGSFTGLMKWVEQYKKAGRLYEPDLYVWLQATPTVSLIRKKRKEDSIIRPTYLWNNRSFLMYLNQFYHKYFENRRNVVPIDTSFITFGAVRTKLLKQLNKHNIHLERNGSSRYVQFDVELNVRDLSRAAIIKRILTSFKYYQRASGWYLTMETLNNIKFDADVISSFKQLLFTINSKGFTRHQWKGFLYTGLLRLKKKLFFEVSRRMLVKFFGDRETSIT